MKTDFPEYACEYAKNLAAKSKSFALQVYDPPEFSEEADEGYGTDPFGELAHSSRCYGLKQRFPDRVLVMTADKCFMNCRHCTRRALLERAEVVRTEEELAACVGYVKAHPEVRDVLLSGGDILTLGDDEVMRFVDAFAALAQVEVIRVCTRALCTNPSRITPRLAERLAASGKVWVNTQFNSADEVTAEAREAAAELVGRGIPVSCQSVLLKGVNDSDETMIALLRALSAARIRPYYVFMCDPVAGIGRFRVPLAKAREIELKCAEALGGLSLPRFVADVPGARRKIPIAELVEGCGSKERLPLVSMIVPAYNVAGTVSATIEALLAQDYPNFEVVAVDDGSSDATAEILDRFAGSDSRLRVVHKQNGGYGSAINVGLAEARGEWIGILESDDVCRADMLSRLVAEGEGHKADMVKADWRLWWHEKGDARPAGKIRRSWRGHFLTRRERLELCRVSPAIWSAIYRKDFLSANGIYCLETLGGAFQDTSFNIKAVLSCERLAALPDAFVDYRQDNPNSSVRSKTQVESILFEYAELFAFLRRRPDIAQWATDCVRELEYKAYLWNLKRIAPEQRLDFIAKVRESGCVRKLFASPEKLVKKISGKVARRERRKRRLVSLHVNARKIELIVFGRTIFYKSF